MTTAWCPPFFRRRFETNAATTRRQRFSRNDSAATIRRQRLEVNRVEPASKRRPPPQVKVTENSGWRCARVWCAAHRGSPPNTLSPAQQGERERVRGLLIRCADGDA